MSRAAALAKLAKASDLAAEAARLTAEATEELERADDWVDQDNSPLGRRLHCEAARTGALKARKVRGKWKARGEDVDAYIQAYGTKPPATREGEDEAKTIADIRRFRAPRRGASA